MALELAFHEGLNGKNENISRFTCCLVFFIEMEIKKAEKNVKQIKKQRSFRILKDVQNRLEEEVHRLKGEIKQLKELYI